jgi:hypothetical protein
MKKEDGICHPKITLVGTSAHMEDAQRTAGIELSDDALLRVLSLLDATDLCSAACVSRQWRRVCGSKTLWTVIDLGNVVAQRVTHKRLLNLVVRAQGGLRALTIDDRGSVTPKLSEVTLAAIVQQSPDLAFILGFSKVCTKSVEHVFGADSAQELMDKLVQPDVSPADVMNACLFLQATGDFINIFTGTTLMSLPVVNGLISQLDKHASDRRLVHSVLAGLVSHVLKIRPVAGIEIWRALRAHFRAALTTHIDDNLIVHTSLYLLSVIHRKLVLEAQMIVLRDGACFAEMIAAIRKHAASYRVQLMGCKLMSRLVDNVESSVEAGAAGAVPTMIAAMWNFADNATLQADCCSGIYCITRHNAVHKAEAIRAGAVRAIEAAVQAHASNTDVQQFGSQALAALRA